VRRDGYDQFHFFAAVCKGNLSFLTTDPEMDETSPLLPSITRSTINEPQDADGPFIDFDSNSDPDNPLEWPKAYKIFIVLLLAFMAFTVYVDTRAMTSNARY
jgi:hypothetical protein